MPEFTFTWSRFNELQRKAAAEDLTDHEGDEYDALVKVWEEAKAEGRRREERLAEEERRHYAEQNPTDPDGSVASCLAAFQRTRDQQRGVTWHRHQQIEIVNPDGSRSIEIVAPSDAGKSVHRPSAARSGLALIQSGLAA